MRYLIITLNKIYYTDQFNPESYTDDMEVIDNFTHQFFTGNSWLSIPIKKHTQ